MSSRTRTGWLSLALICALVPLGMPSHAGDTLIPSKWQVQEINYSYMAFTTAYDCNSAATKIASILKELGTHPSTKVRASGCDFNRPSRNFFVTVTAAIPVPAADVKPATAADQSKQELLKRLGVNSDLSTTEFPAQWQTVDLTKNRRLNLQPGDCELLEGLQKYVLPKLGMKATAQRVQCTPHQIGMTTPQLTVSALVAVKSPDEKPTG